MTERHPEEVATPHRLKVVDGEIKVCDTCVTSEGNAVAWDQAHTAGVPAGGLTFDSRSGPSTGLIGDPSTGLAPTRASPAASPIGSGSPASPRGLRKLAIGSERDCNGERARREKQGLGPWAGTAKVSRRPDCASSATSCIRSARASARAWTGAPDPFTAEAEPENPQPLT